MILNDLSALIFSLLFVSDVYAIYLYKKLLYFKQAFLQKKSESLAVQEQLIFNKKWTAATEAILMKAVRKSQEKRALLELQKNELQEKNAEVMAQNEKLTAIAHIHSHKIRQPTASILGLCSIISKDTLTEENRRYIDMIEQSAFKLDSLIHEIVDYAGDE